MAVYPQIRFVLLNNVLEAAGISNVLAKSLGSPTHINVAKATVDALKSQQRPDQVAKAHEIFGELRKLAKVS